MKKRELIRRLLLLYGSVLILISLQARFGFAENEFLLHERSEGGLAYGLLLTTLGIVLMTYKDISVMKFLWISWSGMFLVQISRLFLMGIYVSKIMYSLPLFWGTMAFGVVFGIFTIWYKIRHVF